MTKASLPRMDVLGVPVNLIDMPRAVAAITGLAEDTTPHTVFARDVASLMLAVEEPQLRRLHDEASLVVPDGMPLVWLGRLRGHDIGRVAGPDLVDAVCARLAGTGQSHYFYGGKPGVAEKMASRLAARYPGLKIAGIFSPPMRDIGPAYAFDASGLAELRGNQGRQSGLYLDRHLQPQAGILDDAGGAACRPRRFPRRRRRLRFPRRYRPESPSMDAEQRPRMAAPAHPRTASPVAALSGAGAQIRPVADGGTVSQGQGIVIRDVLGRLYKISPQARWAVSSQLITSGANFLTTLVILHALGLEELGRFSICFLLIMIVRNFLGGMVLLPMSIIGPKLRPTSAPAYRGFLGLNALAFAALSSLLLFAASAPLGVVLNAPWLPALALPLALANFAANGADYFRRYHFVYDAPARAFGIDAIRFAVQLAIMLRFALFLPAQFSVEAALYAMAAGACLGALAGTRNYGRIRWSRPLTRVLWPRHWHFIKWMTPSVALEALQANAPLLIGGAVLGESALGLVRAMQSLANILNLPFNALQQIAPSMAATALATRGPPALKTLLTTMTLWSAAAILALSLVVIILSGPLIGLGFRADPAQALPILLAYCALNLVIVLRFPLTIAVQAIEKPQITTLANAIGAIAAACTILAIPLFGALAIPLASLFIAMVTALVYLAGRPFGQGAAAIPTIP